MIVGREDEDAKSWSTRFRGIRHNPCLMTPTTAVIMLIICLFSIVSFALRFPTIILGIMIRPLLTRFYWAVEFLYPMGIVRWAHIFLMRQLIKVKNPKPDDANKGYHSRAVETRIEVVQDRVYIHPLPQLLDNLGYLVVCLPPPTGMRATRSEANVSAESHGIDPIIAFVVDCGDAQAVARQIFLISDLHYHKQTIQIQSILSTHKHHDHTAGNGDLLKHATFGKSIKLIFGGAVEKVPYCNYPLVNGDYLPLPKCTSYEMNEIIEVEAVATPAHTRGSITYVLRPLRGTPSSGAAYFFTGDTMFSSGGGVPFEADIDPNQESKLPRMTANSFIKASASLNAIERCFAEIMYRSVKHDIIEYVSSDRLLVLPGHEYTYELLSRQLVAPDTCKWKNASPAVFFETMSRYYVSLLRRSLPHSSGKLLCIPSTVRSEIMINPYLRNLKSRGELVITTLRSWNRTWAEEKVSDEIFGAYGVNDTRRCSIMKPNNIEKTPSSVSQWNLNADVLNKSVFTTVYSADLDSIIDDLRSYKIDQSLAASRLEEMKGGLYTTVVSRRPIPGTLPSDKSIYKGLLGFALLGSAPTGLTSSDSRIMKLPSPVDSNSDRIRVSKKRLIAVLYHLGLMDKEHRGALTLAIINNLWREAVRYGVKRSTSDDVELEDIIDSSSKISIGFTRNYNSNGESPTTSEVESSLTKDIADEIELGVLKWIVYGIPEQRHSKFLFCMPCSKRRSGALPSSEHPAGKSKWKVHTGELVRHDMFACKLSQSATGFNNSETATLITIDALSKEDYGTAPVHDDEEDSEPVELSPNVAFNSLKVESFQMLKHN